MFYRHFTNGDNFHIAFNALSTTDNSNTSVLFVYKRPKSNYRLCLGKVAYLEK